MSDFTVRYSEEALGKLFDGVIKEEQDAQQALEKFTPELNQLENEATATMRAFSGQVNSVGADQEDIYNKLARTRAVPLKMGKLLGLVLPEYNEDRLLTKAQGNAEAMANSQRKANASLSLIGQRAQAIQGQINNEVKQAELKRGTLSTILSGLDTSMRMEARQQLQDKELLMSVPSAQLQKALAADRANPMVKINGKNFDRGVAFSALTSRQKIDAEVAQAYETLKTSKLGNTEKEMELRQKAISNIAAEMTLPGVIGLEQHLDPQGNVVIQSSAGGPAIQINYNQLQNEFWKHNAAMKDARELQGRMSVGAGALAGHAASLTNKANVLTQLAGVSRDAEGNVINTGDNPYSTELILAANATSAIGNKYATIAQKGKNGEMLTPDEVSMFNMQSRATFEAAAAQTEEASKKLEGALKAGASDARKNSIDEMINNQNKIISAKVATDQFGESAYMPSDFTGHRGIIGTYVQGMVEQKAKERRGVKFTAEGKLDVTDPATMKVLFQTGIQREDATTKYLDSDQYMRENGIGGLKGATMYADTDYILNAAANDYVKAYKKDTNNTAVSPLEDALMPDGSWSPEFQAYRQKLGPTYGLMQYLVDKEAADIASGKKSVNENTATRIGSYVLKRMQDNTLRLPDANTPTMASLNKIVYDNNPNAQIGQIVNSVFAKVPTLLLNEVKRQQDSASGNLAIAEGRGRAVEPGANVQGIKSTNAAVQSYYDTLKNNLGNLP